MYNTIHNRYITVSEGDEIASVDDQITGPSPNLKTILMVEEVLKEMDDSIITVAELKRRLPKKVNHNKLKIILRYLEESNKVLFTTDGLTWIFNSNPNLRREISKGLEL
jgi:hypothetical protein